MNVSICCFEPADWIIAAYTRRTPLVETGYRDIHPSPFSIDASPTFGGVGRIHFDIRPLRPLIAQTDFVHQPPTTRVGIIYLERIGEVLLDECRRPRRCIISHRRWGILESVLELCLLFLSEFPRAIASVVITGSFCERLLFEPLEPTVNRPPLDAIPLGELGL